MPRLLDPGQNGLGFPPHLNAGQDDRQHEHQRDPGRECQRQQKVVAAGGPAPHRTFIERPERNGENASPCESGQEFPQCPKAKAQQYQRDDNPCDPLRGAGFRAVYLGIVHEGNGHDGGITNKTFPGLLLGTAR